KTLKEYNENKNKDEFGKEVFDLKISENESIYIGIVTPAIHYTMGGIKINEHAEVLSSYEDEVIEGLFAAGEVTGGIHGKNRLGGNSLLDCAVFGKKAAESAIDYLAYLY
ncbi:MAG: FAD-binding protein, partial [archaeon]|nr:FAD-binding protein [archaeon]